MNHRAKYLLHQRSFRMKVIAPPSHTHIHTNTVTHKTNQLHYTSAKVVDIARWPNSITLSWSQTRPKLVADRSETARRPAASWNLAYHALSSSLAASQQVCDRSASSLGPVCDQDSVMECGFYSALRARSVCLYDARTYDRVRYDTVRDS